MRQEFNIGGRVVEAALGSGAVRVGVAPNEQERPSLLATCDIDEHTLQSALDPDEVSRVEVEDDYLFIIWKRPSPAMFRNARVFQVESLGVHVHPGG